MTYYLMTLPPLPPERRFYSWMIESGKTDNSKTNSITFMALMPLFFGVCVMSVYAVKQMCFFVFIIWMLKLSGMIFFQYLWGIFV